MARTPSPCLPRSTTASAPPNPLSLLRCLDEGPAPWTHQERERTHGPRDALSFYARPRVSRPANRLRQRPDAIRLGCVRRISPRLEASSAWRASRSRSAWRSEWYRRWDSGCMVPPFTPRTCRETARFHSPSAFASTRRRRSQAALVMLAGYRNQKTAFTLAELLSRRRLDRPCETVVGWAREA
jgi:hypothetical protein